MWRLLQRINKHLIAAIPFMMLAGLVPTSGMAILPCSPLQPGDSLIVSTENPAGGTERGCNFHPDR